MNSPKVEAERLVSEAGEPDTMEETYLLTQALASLAIAEQLARVGDEIKAFRELMGNSAT